ALDVHLGEIALSVHERRCDDRAVEVFPIVAAGEPMAEVSEVGLPLPDFEVEVVLAVVRCGGLTRGAATVRVCCVVLRDRSGLLHEANEHCAEQVRTMSAKFHRYASEPA